MTPYYEQDGITIYRGDCRDVLPRLLPLPAETLVMSDPPYGIEHETSHGASWQNTQIAGDSSTEVRDWIIGTLKPLAMVVFGTWKVARPADVRAVLIWDKGPAFGMGDLSFPWKGSFEEIYIIGDGWSGRRDEGVLRGHIVPSWESRGRKHPHEKPVSLARHFINKHPAPLVVDPTCGTGFALQAAKLEGRRAIGIEVEERHCETAANRLAQGVLFGAAETQQVNQ
jgi:DNA modification methylase